MPPDAIRTPQEVDVSSRRPLLRRVVGGLRPKKLVGWRARLAIAVLRLAWSRAVALLTIETTLRWKHRTLSVPPPEVEIVAAAPSPKGQTTKPTVYISACMDANAKGGWRYNGGIKEFNLLAKLLRQRGYEAFIVTYDGTYDTWLIDHQPVISLDEFERRLAIDRTSVRLVTSWAIADAFIHRAKHFYFWDMELRYTANDHFAIVAKFYRQARIVATGGISRTVQAFHMAHYEAPCTVVPNLLDVALWKPDATKRVANRIGYMDEGKHSRAFADHASSYLTSRGIAHELICLNGDESAILNAMQTCDLYVSMNLGKDVLWGEGCPRTIIESMSAGCLNLSFDIIGNREIVIPGWNGVLIEDKTAEALASMIALLLNDRPRIETLRLRSLAVVSECHTFEKRWPSVERFLDL